MKKDIRKEFLFSIRNSRFLIIAAAFMFLGLLTPLMLKVILPMVFSSQFPGMDEEMIAQMIDMSQFGSLQGFFGDLYEMGTVIVAFSLCGLVAQELKDNTLVIPLCSGKRFSDIVLSKMIVFSLVMTISTIASASVSYLYSGLLFDFEVKYASILQSSLLHSLYLIFILACLILVGSLTSKPIATGLTTLIISYGIHGIGSLLAINKWLPSGLIIQAQTLGKGLSDIANQGVVASESTGTAVIEGISSGKISNSSLALSVTMTAVLIITFTALSILRLRTMEHNRR
ncbi:MAG: hypothetical protein GXY22_07935 [Clostridiaceae bacterium]|nr:hypothetical protein [Clostridiaceae bacterium]